MCLILFDNKIKILYCTDYELFIIIIKSFVALFAERYILYYFLLSINFIKKIILLTNILNKVNANFIDSYSLGH